MNNSNKAKRRRRFTDNVDFKIKQLKKELGIDTFTDKWNSIVNETRNLSY